MLTTRISNDILNFVVKGIFETEDKKLEKFEKNLKMLLTYSNECAILNKLSLDTTEKFVP